jgi:DNA-directed RNA polymerase specialized sigma24 family protein
MPQAMAELWHVVPALRNWPKMSCTAYLKILQGRARYRDGAAFKTWLFAVIRLTAADERRRQCSSSVATIQGEYLVRRAVAGPDIVMAPEPEHQRRFNFLRHMAIDQT